MKLTINSPDDSAEEYSTTITFAGERRGKIRIQSLRHAKDPIHAGLVKYFKRLMDSRKYDTFWTNGLETVVNIGVCPILLSHTGIRYSINGQPESVKNICSALARVTFKSCFTEDPTVLMKTLYSSLSLPENVKYCIENRVPFHFFEDYVKIEVRLQVQLISDKMLAIEVSDGVWGTISSTDLNTFCNFYLNGHRKGSWKYLSPYKLYTRLMEKEPSQSELKLMIAFLKQNRTQDMVEERAKELVDDLLIQYSDKLHGVHTNGEVHEIYVHGHDYDWKLTGDGSQGSSIQMVSTYVWAPSASEEGEEPEPYWKGPICIDNMSEGSSLGDQFAARVLALLNDNLTVGRVSTISRYLTASPDEHRLVFDEL